MKDVVLTGIKPTGKIHLGNYIGAIKPALELAQNKAMQSAYFIADYHGLINIHNKEKLNELSYSVAATWLALGLDPSEAIFYRQSDVPELFELNWILSCFTPKGLMNRAHAYKAKVEENKENTQETDFGVSMGLYNYPILMSADILGMQAKLVPVGNDQIQHIEIARDIAAKFNGLYGETFLLPGAVVKENTAVIPGLDGRKMSKSYHNTIPLFEEPKKLQKLINQIVTDSLPPEVPKNPNTSTIFKIYEHFASEQEIEAFRHHFEQGIGYGDAKKELFRVVNTFLEEPRAKYEVYMNNKELLDHILEQGAQKARTIATPFLHEVKEKIGLRY